MNAISTDTLEFAAQSDRGRVRSGNEDAYGQDLAQGIFVVCDGMGGAAAGEVASRMAVQTILEQWTQTDLSEATDATKANKSAPGSHLRAAVQEANTRIFRRSMKDARLQGMGTTAVILFVQQNEKESTAWVAHAGDSRCYRYRAGELIQLTIDHSLVEEQVRLGHMTREQAESSPFRNVITRAVGAASSVEVDVLSEAAHPGDLYLLCSDGLTRELDDSQISAMIAAHLAAVSPMQLDDISADLVRAANKHGGRDNITCILVRVG